MTAEPNDPRHDSDSAADGGNVERPYEPHHFEPSSETSSPNPDWEDATPTDIGLAEPAESASVPDASPLLDEQVKENQGHGQGKFWNEGGSISGATSNSRPIPPQ